MAQARPLYDIFAGLADAAVTGAAPEEVLREAGYDLPDALVAEAIVSYAGTAPAEVAEHLAPFVTAHGPVPPADPTAATPELADGLALLASAPVPDLADIEAEAALPQEGAASDAEEADQGTPEPAADPFDLDFGGGEGPGGDEVAAAVVPEGFGTFDPTVPEPADPLGVEDPTPDTPADRPTGADHGDLGPGELDHGDLDDHGELDRGDPGLDVG